MAMSILFFAVPVHEPALSVAAARRSALSYLRRKPFLSSGHFSHELELVSNILRSLIMSPIISNFILQVKKCRSAFDKLRKEYIQGDELLSVDKAKAQLIPTASPWDILPAEIQIEIFAHCSIGDLLPLKLVCRAFYQLLTLHEHEISRQYLRRRRHGSLPSPIVPGTTHTRNPQDDVILLSDLFPPSKSAKGGYLYTYRYLHSLRRRQRVCSKLCYYLADRVVDRFFRTESAFVKSKFPSKSERNALFQRGVACILFNFTPLMYYTLYFLETYSLARREHRNSLLRAFETGRLPVPIPANIRKTMYRELQAKILRSPPFTDTNTLISTHHCMHLLVSYLRHTVPPDESGEFDDSWIGSLLTVSPLLRIVEFFSAEIGDGGSQRTQRKDFMYNFHNDIETNERDDMNSLVFEPNPNSHIHASVSDVWFDVAREELGSRKAVPHRMEKVWVWEGVPILFGCRHCGDDSRGWCA